MSIQGLQFFLVGGALQGVVLALLLATRKTNQLGKNFYDFINHYRVAEAQLLLVDPRYRHLTHLAVAEEAGFNSKATFNAVFKKQTGQTPSEYIRSYGQQTVRT
jgi:AraC-like DNA-binding protein